MLKIFQRLKLDKLFYAKSYVQSPRILSTVKHINPVRYYGIRPSIVPYVEEDTLSFKILAHMRTNNRFTTAKRKERIQYSLKDDQAIKQLTLVIAHNPEIKTSDVIQLFSLYASTGHFLTQDVISNKNIMAEVKSKTMKSIGKMTENELINFAYLLKELGYEKSGYLQSFVKGVREECLRSAQDCDLLEGLRLFDILLIFHGNKIYRKYEFDTFLSLFERKIETASSHHLVQILHYIGLAKKRKLSKEFVYEIIQMLDKHYHTLTFEDIGIAVAGVFKSNVKLDKKSLFVTKVAESMKAKLTESSLTDLESYGLVAMIKLVRAARFHDNELLSSMKIFIMKCDKNVFSAQTVPHILAMFSNNNEYDQEIFHKLEREVLELIQADSHDLRMRDLVRVLWCFSHMDHKCHQETMEAFEKCLLEFVHNGEVARSPHFLSDALLSMAILKHYPNELIKEAFKPELLQGLQGHQKSKQLSRLLILHECLKIEVPSLILKPPVTDNADVPKRTLADELYYRPLFRKLSEGAKWINSVVGKTVFKLQFPVPYINYASIGVDINQLNFKDSASLMHIDIQQRCIIEQLTKLKDSLGKNNISIEVLDSQCLINQTSNPVGIVRLKMRLLRQLQWGVLSVSNAEVESCGGDDDVGALLLKKITSG